MTEQRPYKRFLGDTIKPLTSDGDEASDFEDHKIKFALKHAAGKKTLDLGCVHHDPKSYSSRYWVHKALLEKCSSVLGVDIYADGVNYLKDKGYNIIVGDACDLKLDEKFDVIFAGDIIEHLDNFYGFFDSAQNNLTDDGVLLISTPNPYYWRCIVKQFLFSDARPNPEHTCWFCTSTLRQLASRFHFELIDLAYGSRDLKDRLNPLPTGIKHTSFHCAFKKQSVR